MCYDLYEAKASEKKTELQTILFRLADRVSELTEQLKGKSVIITCEDCSGTGLIKLSIKKLLNPPHFRTFLFICFLFVFAFSVDTIIKVVVTYFHRPFNHCIVNVLYSVVRFLRETKESKGIYI